MPPKKRKTTSAGQKKPAKRAETAGAPAARAPLASSPPAAVAPPPYVKLEGAAAGVPPPPPYAAPPPPTLRAVADAALNQQTALAATFLPNLKLRVQQRVQRAAQEGAHEVSFTVDTQKISHQGRPVSDVLFRAIGRQVASEVEQWLSDCRVEFNLLESRNRPFMSFRVNL